MYEKVSLIVLVVFVVARGSEEIVSDTKVDTKSSDSSLSDLPSYTDDQHLTKDDQMKSPLLLMPHKNENETIYKTKRCSTLSKRKKPLLIKKEDSPRYKTSDEDINVGASKDDLNINAEPCKKGKLFLRILNGDVDGKDVTVNLQPRKTIKKSNVGKCICYCKDKNCSSMSTNENTSQMLSSSRKDKSEKTNYRTPEHESKRLNILQRKLSNLQQNNLYRPRIPNFSNPFAIRPYQERLTGIPVLIRYGIIPYHPFYMLGNAGKAIEFVGIPPTSFKNKPNFLVGSNMYPQYRPLTHQNTHLNSPVTENREAGNPDTSISSLSSYTEAENVPESHDSSGIVGKAQDSPELDTELPNNYGNDLVDVATENNSSPDYVTNLIKENNTVDFSKSDETLNKSEDSTEMIKANEKSDPGKMTSSPTEYISASGAPTVIYSPITHDGKLINMEECMKLFDRDVCVLSATSSQMSMDRMRENDLNGYTTIAVPEYIVQMSSKKDMTTDHVNSLNKYFATSEKSDIDSNVSTNTELNVDENALPGLSQYTSPVVQTYEPRANSDKNELSSTTKDTFIPKKILHTQTDKTVETVSNRLLGKSKNHEAKLSLTPNNNEMENPSSGEEFLQSNTPQKHIDKIVSNLINQQRVPSASTTRKNIPQEDITVASYPELATRYNKEETATVNHDFNVGHNFQTEAANFIKPDFNVYSDEDVPSTTMRYYEVYEELDEPSNKDDNFNVITDFTPRRLPFCDNTLLLNSIRKVINDFTLDTRVARTRDLDENILQLHGESLLPEILQVPHLKNILLTPRVEDTIVERVKGVLSDVTAIPRKQFANDWSHGVIRDTLRNILEVLPGFRRKLPPMTLEERQFKDGQWTSNLVTLAPMDNQLSKTSPEALRENIKNLLGSPAIASQTDHHVVRNIIVQSVKNTLHNDENEQTDEPIIYNALDDVLRIFKNSEDINAVAKSNKFVTKAKNRKTTISRGMTTERYKIENIKESILGKEKSNIEKGTIIGGNNDIRTVASDSSNLSELYDKNKNIYSEQEVKLNKAIDVIKETIGDQIVDGINKVDVQNKGNEFIESSKPTVTYQKASLQNDPSTLKHSIESNLRDEVNPDRVSNGWSLEEIENYRKSEENITPIRLTQETSSQISDDSSDGKWNKNVGDETEYSSNGETISPDDLISSTNTKYKNPQSEVGVTSAADEIDPAIILARLEYNLPPIKYYSPENLKYIQNHGIEDQTEIATSINFMGKLLPNHDVEAASDSIIGQTPAAGAKNAGDEMEAALNENSSATSTDPLIVSENNILKHGNYGSQISPLMDKDDLALQRNFPAKDDVVKTHEVTTEIQRTYTRTTYFKPKSSTVDDSRFSLLSSIPETTDDTGNSKSKPSMYDNTNKNNYELIGNDIINNINRIEANEAIISSPPSSLDDAYSLQLFPSSTAPNDIFDLQNSQLYYISDGVKLPVEIIKLKDGSYGLSMSRNICEIILRKKCSCHVPLQGRIVRSSRRDQQEENADEKDYLLSTNGSSSETMNSITTKNTLEMQKEGEQEEKEEEINARHLRKRNLNKNLTISMPVIEFARKYNLTLDFNEEDVLLNTIESEGKDIETNHPSGFEGSKLIKFRSNMQNAERTEDNHSNNDGKYEKLPDNYTLQNAVNILKKEKREDKESGAIDDERNVSGIRILKENIARPRRYEQDTTIVNGGTRVIKSMLYWIKSLFDED